MQLTIFAKKRKTKDGRTFTAYVTKLTKTDGTTVTAGVKFREDCGAPKSENCPCVIEINKREANLSTSTYVREDTGEIAKSHTLCVSAWEMVGPWVDTSLDDYE